MFFALSVSLILFVCLNLNSELIYTVFTDYFPIRDSQINRLLLIRIFTGLTGEIISKFFTGRIDNHYQLTFFLIITFLMTVLDFRIDFFYHIFNEILLIINTHNKITQFYLQNIYFLLLMEGNPKKSFRSFQSKAKCMLDITLH